MNEEFVSAVRSRHGVKVDAKAFSSGQLHRGNHVGVRCDEHDHMNQSLEFLDEALLGEAAIEEQGQTLAVHRVLQKGPALLRVRPKPA